MSNGSSTHVLTVAKAGKGAGSVVSAPTGIDCSATCSASIASGASVTLTATAAAGSWFAGWSGACSGAKRTCTVSMSEARTVTATFDLVIAASRSELTTRKGRVLVRVRTAGAGTVQVQGALAASGRGASAALCSGRIVVRKAGTYDVLCTPSASLRALRLQGPVRIALTMVFTPTGGTASSSRIGTVTLPRISVTPSAVTG